LISDMNQALQFPGVSNAWTMPIRARIDMLSTGIRTPVGVKVYGNDLAEIDRLSKQIEAVVRRVPGTTSAFAERVLGGYYLNIEPNRAALARYGLSIDDVQNVVRTALGGEMVTETVEGRERYGVTVRYPRDFRDNPAAIAREVLVNAPDGTPVPLGQVASISIAQGPPSIRNWSTISMLTCRAATSAATSTKPVRRCRIRSNCWPAIISSGAASSSI